MVSSTTQCTNHLQQENKMTQPQSQQSDKLRFQKKSIKDQAETIKEQEKRIAEWIEQQQDPRHNQE